MKELGIIVVYFDNFPKIKYILIIYFKYLVGIDYQIYRINFIFLLILNFIF